MTKAGVITVLVLAVGGGLGSFFVTVAQVRHGAPATPLEHYLGLSAERAQLVQKADPAFSVEAERLSATLDTARDGLARLLETPSATDREILDQVEQVITAQDALERRVARHVLAIRPHLTPDQQKRLMGLCAHGVRQGGGSRWRGGRGERDAGGLGPGRGGGHGGGPGS